MLIHGVQSRFAFNRHSSCQASVHHATKRVNIRAFVAMKSATLFWTHEYRAAHDGSDCGQLLVELRRNKLGQSEIHDFDDVFFCLRVDHHDVTGLDVSVDDTIRMSMFERIAYLNEYPAKKIG